MSERNLSLEQFEKEVLSVDVEHSDNCDIKPQIVENKGHQISQELRYLESSCDISDFNNIQIKSLADLMEKDIAPIKWLVPNMIPEGACLFFAAPKVGKSQAMLDLALAVGKGGKWLGTLPLNQGKALYLDLENGETILQQRTASRLFNDEKVENVFYSTAFNRINENGLEDLDKFLTENSDVNLVIIDTLERIRSIGNGRNLYREDYNAVSSLNDLAHKHHITIIIVHHTNQSDTDDFYTACSGTNGLTSGVDGAMYLKRPRLSSDAELTFGGRLVEERKIELSFDTTLQSWKVRNEILLSPLAKHLEKHSKLKDLSKSDMNTINGNRSNGVDSAIIELKQAGLWVSYFAKPNGRRIEMFQHINNIKNEITPLETAVIENTNSEMEAANIANIANIANNKDDVTLETTENKGGYGLISQISQNIGNDEQTDNPTVSMEAITKQETIRNKDNEEVTDNINETYDDDFRIEMFRAKVIDALVEEMTDLQKEKLLSKIFSRPELYSIAVKHLLYKISKLDKENFELNNLGRFANTIEERENRKPFSETYPKETIQTLKRFQIEYLNKQKELPLAA